MHWQHTSDTCTVACDSGYTAAGVLKCTASGTFKLVQGNETCDRRHCAPFPVLHAAVPCTGVYHDVFTPSSNKGYTPSISMVTTCGADGTFTGDAECIIVQCAPLTLPGAAHGGCIGSYGDKCTRRCEVASTNGGQLTCQATGRVSGFASCAVDCPACQYRHKQLQLPPPCKAGKLGTAPLCGLMSFSGSNFYNLGSVDLIKDQYKDAFAVDVWVCNDNTQEQGRILSFSPRSAVHRIAVYTCKHGLAYLCNIVIAGKTKNVVMYAAALPRRTCGKASTTTAPEVEDFRRLWVTSATRVEK